MRPVRAVHTVQLSARLARPRPLPKSRTTPRHFSLSIPPSSASSSFLFTTPSTKTSVLTAGSRSQVEASDILGAKGFSSQCRRSVMFDDEVLPNRFELPGPEGTLEELCEVLHSQVDAFLDSEPSTGLLQDVQNQVRTSLKILDETFNRYRLDQLAISYNGGKDCLVLLVLYLASLHAHFKRPLSANGTTAAQHQGAFPGELATVYIQDPNSFFEVDEFVRSSSQQYHLSVFSSTSKMKDAFAEYLESHPSTKAIFVGTRRTDPHGAPLTHFAPTNGGWPDFMRIHPVIDWHYREIWGFIRHFDLPYCPLYDLGYTSLGGTTDTFPNPKLRKPDTTDKHPYKPAYELQEDEEERLGRQKRFV